MAVQPKWQARLQKELRYERDFRGLTIGEWRLILRKQRILSSNHDTIVSLDFAHFCDAATAACGGVRGWCYTFQGHQASEAHHRRAMMISILAEDFPDLLAERVASEVDQLVQKKVISYPNLRYSGSGEMRLIHVPALRSLVRLGIHVWGFTRNIKVANSISEAGGSVLISCDYTSSPALLRAAEVQGYGLAYTSRQVEDVPPDGTVVCFPLHRGGRVREVVASGANCPKVVEEFLDGRRREGWCQTGCVRCHLRA